MLEATHVEAVVQGVGRPDVVVHVGQRPITGPLRSVRYENVGVVGVRCVLRQPTSTRRFGGVFWSGG